VFCDVCPEKLVCLGFLTGGAFSNHSLGITQQFHSGTRHFRRGKDTEKGVKDREKGSKRKENTKA